MATVEKYDDQWTRAAKKRWPGFYVSGTGPFAVLNFPLASVKLFEIEFFAHDYWKNRSDAKYLELHRLVPDFGVVGRACRSKATADSVERECR